MVSAISSHAISNNALLSGAFGPGLAPEITSISRTQSKETEKTQSGGRESTAESTGGDTVEISDAARALLASLEITGSVTKATQHGQVNQQGQVNQPSQSKNAQSVGTEAAETTGSNQISGEELTDEEEQQVQKLKQRDTEVRTHEQAHASAAGGNARGGPKLEFETGPDGRQYAVSGEVSIDTSPVSGNPQATIAKMQQVRRAALAPAQPSGQDRSVASQAQVSEREARAELAEQSKTELGGTEETQTQQPVSISNQAASIGKPSKSANPTAAIKTNLSNSDKSQAPGGPTLGLILDIAG